MEKQVNWSLELNEFVGQFGYSVKGLTKEQINGVENAIEDGSLEIDREQNAGSEWATISGYVGGCFENNFNL